MTDEQRKALTLYLGLCWHDLFQVHPSEYGLVTCVKCGENMPLPNNNDRTFDNDADMMALFRKMVDYLNFGAFQNFAYKYFNEYPNYTFTEWLFYDPSRFCCLVAQWIMEVMNKEGK